MAKYIIYTLFIALLMVAGWRCQQYESLVLPFPEMEFVRLAGLDSLLMQAEIFEPNPDEYLVLGSGFIVAEEALQLVDGEYKGLDQEKTWEIPSLPSPDNKIQGSLGGLIAEFQKYAVVAFVDVELPDRGQINRVYSEIRFAVTGSIRVFGSYSRVGQEVTLRMSVTGLEGESRISAYGHCWQIHKEALPELPNFKLEEVADTNITQYGPSNEDVVLFEEKPTFPLAKFLYVRPYAIYKGVPLYGEVQEIFLGNFWFNQSYCPGGPGRLTEAVSFALEGKGYIVTGAKGLALPDTTITNEFWEFDPESSCWTQLEDFPGAPRVNATGFVMDGKAYVGLGRNGQNPGDHQFRDFYEYTLASGWQAIESFPIYLRSAASFVINGKAYVGTGYSCTDGIILNNSACGTTKKMYAFDPTEGDWVAVRDFPFKIQESAGFSIDGKKGFIVGGLEIVNDHPNPNFRLYDPRRYCYEFLPSAGINGGWVLRENLGGGERTNSLVFEIGEKVYVGSGYNKWIEASSTNVGFYKDLWAFSQEEDWTQVADIVHTGQVHGATFVLNNKAYLYGGYNFVPNPVLSDELWVYEPDRN